MKALFISYPLFKMSVNIEHFQIDQDTEYCVESILTVARANGYDGNFALADSQSDPEFLPGGNVIKYLDKVADIAADVIGKTKSPTKRRRLIYEMNKVVNFREMQAQHFAETGRFMAFPASPYGPLSAHLRGEDEE